MTQTPTRTKTDTPAPATTGTSLGERWASRLGNISAKGLLLVGGARMIALFARCFLGEEDVAE